MAKRGEGLIPLNERPFEEAQAIRKMGGESKKRAKTLKRELKLAAVDVLNRKVDSLTELNRDGTYKKVPASVRLMEAMYEKALKGDVSAATFLRDTSGQAPVKEIRAQLNSMSFEIFDDLAIQLDKAEGEDVDIHE